MVTQDELLKKIKCFNDKENKELEDYIKEYGHCFRIRCLEDIDIEKIKKYGSLPRELSLHYTFTEEVFSELMSPKFVNTLTYEELVSEFERTGLIQGNSAEVLYGYYKKLEKISVEMEKL